MNDVRPTGSKPARAKAPNAKYVVLKVVAETLTRQGLPPLDERLKSIVASQVGTLLKGGWSLDEIRQGAVDLALSWDEKRGHSRLAHLAQRMRLLDAERDRRRHLLRMATERLELAAAGEKLPLIAGRPHPNTHEFAADDQDHDSCRLCGGPLGVHVRLRVETT